VIAQAKALLPMDLQPEIDQPCLSL